MHNIKDFRVQTCDTPPPWHTQQNDYPCYVVVWCRSDCHCISATDGAVEHTMLDAQSDALSHCDHLGTDWHLLQVNTNEELDHLQEVFKYYFSETGSENFLTRDSEYCCILSVLPMKYSPLYFDDEAATSSHTICSYVMENMLLNYE